MSFVEWVLDAQHVVIESNNSGVIQGISLLETWTSLPYEEHIDQAHIGL